jgi:hypothetical protein
MRLNSLPVINLRNVFYLIWIVTIFSCQQTAKTNGEKEPIQHEHGVTQPFVKKYIPEPSERDAYFRSGDNMLLQRLLPPPPQEERKSIFESH